MVSEEHSYIEYDNRGSHVQEPGTSLLMFYLTPRNTLDEGLDESVNNYKSIETVTFAIYENTAIIVRWQID